MSHAQNSAPSGILHKILNICQILAAVVVPSALIFPRSAKYAGPEAASIDAVVEFLQSHPEVDVVALVQCTSPFLRPGELTLF